MCGNDGQTYENDCFVQDAICKNSSLAVSSVGSCDGDYL